MLVIKLITVLLAGISIIKSYIDYRKKREPQLMFIFWTFIWLAAVVVVLYPLLIEQIIAYSQDKSITVGSLTALAFIFMLYIVYRVYTKVARIEYQQAELVRQLGLKRALKNDRK